MKGHATLDSLGLQSPGPPVHSVWQYELQEVQTRAWTLTFEAVHSVHTPPLNILICDNKVSSGGDE